MRRLFSMAVFLPIVFVVDALLSVGFGLGSYLFPQSTYATIVDLAGVSEHSLTSSVLVSLSVFYVVIGTVCLSAAFMPAPHNLWIGAIMLVQHGWIGLKGFHESEREWLVGNPWPDIVIHSLFVIAYATAVIVTARGWKAGAQARR